MTDSSPPKKRSEISGEVYVRQASTALCVVLFLVVVCAWISCSDQPSNVTNPGTLKCGDPLPLHVGEATFYTFASGAGNCMFDSTPGDLMVGAMNQVDYDGSQICGASVRITGPRGDTIRIRIVDRCPECAQGDIDLSPLAFSLLADTLVGRIPIRWQIVASDVSGPIRYQFKDGSNQWWTAVQIRNYRYPIAGLQYRMPGGSFKNVNRVMYNYFVETTGMGPGPYTFRVSDMFGRLVTDSNIVLTPGASVPGSSQFPMCE